MANFTCFFLTLINMEKIEILLDRTNILWLYKKAATGMLFKAYQKILFSLICLYDLNVTHRASYL